MDERFLNDLCESVKALSEEAYLGDEAVRTHLSRVTGKAIARLGNGAFLLSRGENVERLIIARYALVGPIAASVEEQGYIWCAEGDYRGMENALVRLPYGAYAVLRARVDESGWSVPAPKADTPYYADPGCKEEKPNVRPGERLILSGPSGKIGEDRVLESGTRCVSALTVALSVRDGLPEGTAIAFYAVKTQAEYLLTALSPANVLFVDFTGEEDPLLPAKTSLWARSFGCAGELAALPVKGNETAAATCRLADAYALYERAKAFLSGGDAQ